MTEEGEGRRTSDVGLRSEEAEPTEAAAPDLAPESEVQSPKSEVPSEEPLLPPYNPDVLRDAVGAARRASLDDDDDDEPRVPPLPGRRRTVMISIAITLVGLAIAALIFLGRANASRYLITCSAERVVAEQGRAFPPWGSRAMTGAEWHAIALPPDAACKPRETEEPAELAHWYYDIVVERASSALTAKSLLDSIPKAGAAATSSTPQDPLDTVAAQLDQALLLARIFDGADQRKEVERLQGDLEYWRATVRLRDASQAMLDAAKQFDEAAARRPRHVDDAAAWATFVRGLAEELRTGPHGAPPATAPNAPPSTAPPGTALPVEPPPSPPAALPPAPDAGVPSGGVLL